MVTLFSSGHRSCFVGSDVILGRGEWGGVREVEQALLALALCVSGVKGRACGWQLWLKGRNEIGGKKPACC